MGRFRRYERCQRYADGKHRWKSDGQTCYCGYRRQDGLPVQPQARTRKQSRVVRLDATLCNRVQAAQASADLRETIEAILTQWLESNGAFDAE